MRLLSFLESEWSVEVKNAFLEKLLNSYSKISSYPKSCVESKLRPNLYKCVVSEQTSFFYRIKEGEIEIITILDNRQNPIVIKKELEMLFSKS